MGLKSKEKAPYKAEEQVSGITRWRRYAPLAQAVIMGVAPPNYNVLFTRKKKNEKKKKKTKPCVHKTPYPPN